MRTANVKVQQIFTKIFSLLSSPQLISNLFGFYQGTLFQTHATTEVYVHVYDFKHHCTH